MQDFDYNIQGFDNISQDGDNLDNSRHDFESTMFSFVTS